jgi:membrane protein
MLRPGTRSRLNAQQDIPAWALQRCRIAYRRVAQMNVKQAWALTKQSISSWSDDYAPSMGAALSYYTLFSITPLLVIVISVAGLLFGADAVSGVIFAQLQSLLGEQGAKAIKEMLSTASRPSTGGFTTAASIVGLLIGATTVFNELQDDLDRIWRVPARAKTSGLWTLLRTRLLSFGMILGVIFLLTISLVTSAALSALGKWWGAWFGGWEVLAHVLDLVINFGLLTLIFALIYKMIPRVHVSWHDVWIGAAVTSLLFTIGKFLIGLYLGKSDMTSAFGAAGSLVIVMVWVYYSAQIFLFGAEFTWVYANTYGSRRNEANQKTATQPADITVPTRSDTGDIGGYAVPLRNDSSEPAAKASPTAPYGAAPFIDGSDTPAEGLQPHANVLATSSAFAPRMRADVTSPTARAKALLRDHRAALGVAVTAAVIVGIVARLGSFKRLLRALSSPRRGTAQRWRAS